MEATPSTKTAPATDKRPHIDVDYPLLSTSQVSNFDECPRKWGFGSLLKLRSPSSAAAELGDDTDTGQLQPYLRDGRPFDFTRPSGYIAASSVRYLPQPKAPGLDVQRQFIMPAPESPGALPSSRPRDDHKYRDSAGKPPAYGYLGYLDMWAPDSSIMPGLEDPLDVRGEPDPLLNRARFTALGYTIPLVGDFKTTKNWKYKKSAEQLDKDNQAMLYATWAMWFTGADVVDLAWVYMRTTGSAFAERTFRRTTLDRVLPEFARIDRTAREMIEIKRAAPPRTEADGPNYADGALLDYVNTLEPNTMTCSKFGGCPYQLGQCNLTQTATVDSLEHADAARRSLGRALPTIQPGNALYEEFTDMTTATTTSTADFLAKMKAKRAGGATPTAPVTTGNINPPESALAPADPVGAVTVTAAAVAAPAQATAKRGRPKGAKNKPVEAATDTETLALTDPEVHTDAIIEPLDPLKVETDPVAAAVQAETVRAIMHKVGATALLSGHTIVPYKAGEAPSYDDAGQEFTVTWPEERFVRFNSFGVGPLTVKDTVKPGQTLEQAMSLALTRLGKVAQDQFATQAQAFQARAAVAAGALEKAAA